jgi:DnaD/phage-associated family protein
MYDWRGLPPGVLSLLITHCVQEARERYGPGRPPTLKQIDREAAAWEREGVDTEARAEAHLAELAERRALRGEVLSLLQIRGRAPSTTEERYIKDWLQSGFSVELIALAYDKTVVRTGALSWKYMDTILKSWNEKRLTTPEEVEQGDTRRQTGAPSAQPKSARARQSAQETAGQHERDAVEDMRDFLKRLREEGG